MGRLARPGPLLIGAAWPIRSLRKRRGVDEGGAISAVGLPSGHGVTLADGADKIATRAFAPCVPGPVVTTPPGPGQLAGAADCSLWLSLEVNQQMLGVVLIVVGRHVWSADCFIQSGELIRRPS